MSSLPSLQELCLTRVLQNGLDLFDADDYSRIEEVAERISSEINPVLRLKEHTDWIAEYYAILAKAGESIKTDRSLAHHSLSWILLQPSLNKLKSEVFWDLKSRNIPFHWEVEMSKIKDFPHLFDLLIRHFPLQMKMKDSPILQAEDLCLLFVARHNYWAGIAYIVEKGANLSIQFPQTPDDPNRNLLHWSIRQNGFNLMTMALIYSGIDLHVPDYEGKTPLELLAEKVPLLAQPGYDLQSALKFLMQKGADVRSLGPKILDQVKLNQIPCLHGSFSEKEKKRQEIIEMIEEAMEFSPFM